MEARKMALDKIYKRRGRYDIPDWQRDEVWSLDHKQLLIDSILNGWKLPKFYFAKTSSDPDEFDVVDGQQRLATIWEFYEGELRLSDASAAKFGGYTYKDLPHAVTDRFDDFEIEYDEITDATDDNIQDFFQRLQGGVTLTAAEKLNAINSGMTRFARTLAKHPFFTEKVSIRDTRKAYFDIATKALAIEIDGFDVRLRYDDLKKLAESQLNFSEDSNVAKRLTCTLDYLNSAFRSKSPILRNRSTIQSLITLTSTILATGRSNGTESQLYEYFEEFTAELARQNELGIKATDAAYLEFQRTLSSNVKSGPKVRHSILSRKLTLSDPKWVDIVGLKSTIDAGVSIEVELLGKEVQKLIAKVNEAYSTKHGLDLFKMTNRTATALGNLREPVSSFESYSTLIGDLYFLLREGTGQRLSGRIPKSFEDVNLLRTGLQHDVDHGKPGAVANKRIKIGEAFARYSGGDTSPFTVAPERFALVQAKLLQAVVSDLGSLAI